MTHKHGPDCDCGHAPNMGYEEAPATEMMASHCLLCGRPLVDAVSVETGIGPVCREKYGYGADLGDPPNWEKFDELLQTAPEAVQENVASTKHRANEQRWKLMNQLIHLAGTRHGTGAADEMAVIASVSELAGALGYRQVQDKILNRYIVKGEGLRIKGILVEEYQGAQGMMWKFGFPYRLGRNVFRSLARKLDAVGAHIQRGEWKVHFVYSEIRWMKVVNALVPELSGTVGVLPNRETFVVPDQPMDVPAEPGGESAGAPDEQTGVDGFDELPPVEAAQLERGMQVQMRDGRTMYVKWFGQQRGGWTVGLAERMDQRGGYEFVGLGDVRTTKPTEAEKQEVEETIDAPLPEPVKERELPEALFPYQREGAIWLDAKLSGLLAFEPGLGKTLTSLSVTDPPAIIVCPAAIRVNWLREVNKWRPDLTASIIGMRRRKRGSGWVKHAPTKAKREEYLREILQANVVIVNYEALLNKQTLDALLDRPLKTLVVDECHRMKELRIRAKRDRAGKWENVPSPRPKAAAAIWHMRQNAERVFMLTGTPMVNGRHYELFPLLHMVSPTTSPFRTFNQYCREFCPPRDMHVGRGRYVKVFTDNTASAALHDLIDGTFMLRKTKDELDLPEKSRRSIYVQLDDEVATEYQRAAQAFLEWVASKGGPEAAMRAARAEAIAKMTSLRRLSAIGKVPAFAEAIVSHLAGTGRPLVVMAHHREAAQQLAGFLDTINENSGKLPSGVQLEREIRYGVYGWGRSDQGVVDAFQSGYPEGAPPEQRQYLDIFIGSILACREGLNLFRASDTYFLERDWRPLICVQAEDRIHRIGQENKCVITYFEGSGTIDGKIAQLLMDKTATAARVIDGKDLSEEEAAEEVMGALFGAATEEYASNRGEFDPEDYDWVEPD